MRYFGILSQKNYMSDHFRHLIGSCSNRCDLCSLIGLSSMTNIRLLVTEKEAFCFCIHFQVVICAHSGKPLPSHTKVGGSGPVMIRLLLGSRIATLSLSVIVTAGYAGCDTVLTAKAFVKALTLRSSIRQPIRLDVERQPQNSSIMLKSPTALSLQSRGHQFYMESSGV